ncbi:MAG: DNA polymerase I [Alphaproteobacteria bacterium]|nr:DNA polymerase I [Alphaproteobacteria bacterium]
MPKKKKMLLVDGSNHAFRVQFALPPMHASDGFPTRVLYGFTLLFQKMLSMYRPDYVVVSFDSGKTFRHETFPDYKGHRPERPADLGQQWPLLPALVEGFGYPCIIMEGFEADDVLGTLARRFDSDDLEILLVTSDKDFAQLVTPNVKLLDEMKNQILDVKGVQEKFGVRPDQIIDMLALMGDTSDNIPGISGIGQKTAAKLLEDYGTLEGILAAAKDGRIKGKRGESLVEGEADAYLSRRLATIATDLDVDVDLAAMEPRGLQVDALWDLFERFEFGMVARNLLPVRKTVDPGCYRAVTTAEDLASAAAAIREAGCVAFDVQWTSQDPHKGAWIGTSLCWGPLDAVWIPHESRPGVELDPEAARKVVTDLLQDDAVALLGHDVKPQLHVLARHGVTPTSIDGDTMLLDYSLMPHLEHNLEGLSKRHLGHSLSHGSLQETLVLADFVRTAVEPVHVAWLVERKLSQRLDEGTRRVYAEIELPLVGILVAMEREGIQLDLKALSDVRKDIAARTDERVAEIYAAAGQEFKLNYAKDVSRVLFDDLGLPKTHSRKLKTGWSTDAAVLEKLAEEHELPEMLLEYRKLQALESRYLATLPDYVAKDGRVHTTFRQAVAATGRLASADPNMQNIPIRTFEGRRIREAFVAAPGHVFLSADYSQVELRILAHYTGAEALVESFRRGEDIHRRTASEVFGVAMEDVSFEQRNAAKAINFGLMYGMSAFRLGRDLSISRQQAQEYMDGYFGRMPKVQEWIEATKVYCREHGYVRTLYGRRRLILEINSKTFSERAAGEREAVNTRVQGTAADIIKIAMIDVDRALKASGLRARLLLQVHDELLLEVPEDEIDATRTLVVDRMQNAAQLDVPLEVNAAVGTDWNGAHG